MEDVRITRVELDRFRSHEKLTVEPGPGITVLVGRNAAGKTNVLEAITLATRGSSFRVCSWGDVVRKGENEARVRVEALRGGVDVTIALSVTSTGSRRYTVNGSDKKRASAIFGRVPTVTFVPDDLQIVKGSAETRRAALDSLGCQMSAPYATLRREYAKVVKQRNSLLKGGYSRVEHEVWTARLAEVGAAFFVHRARLASRLGDRIAPLYEVLSGGERVDLMIECSWDGVLRNTSTLKGMGREVIAVQLEEALRIAESTERDRGITLVGPHRDDVVLSIDALASRSFASQGQQRSLALAWKMAEVKVMREVTGYEPVLLLDDVMSELDQSRREALQRFIQEGPQTMVTTTNLGYFDDEVIANAHILEVGDGR